MIRNIYHVNLHNLLSSHHLISLNLWNDQHKDELQDLWRDEIDDDGKLWDQYLPSHWSIICLTFYHFISQNPIEIPPQNIRDKTNQKTIKIYDIMRWWYLLSTISQSTILSHFINNKIKWELNQNIDHLPSCDWFWIQDDWPDFNMVNMMVIWWDEIFW